MLDDTLIYSDHRRQRRVGRRHAPGRVQRDGQLQRHGRHRDARIHDVQARRVRRRGIVRPLRGRLGVGDGLAVSVDQAGRLALGRHAQRHHRALAQRDQGKGRHPQPVQPRHRRRARRCWKRPAFPSRRWSTACSRARTKAPACSTASTTRKAPERHETQYFEMFCNRGIYHKGWSAVTKHRTPWEMSGGKHAGLRRRRVGALRRQQGLDPGQRPVEGDAREAARAAAAVADRSGQVQRAAARRPADRALRPRAWPDGPR